MSAWLPVIAACVMLGVNAGSAFAHSDASSFGGGAGTHDHVIEQQSQPMRYAARVIFDPRRIHDVSMKVNAQITELEIGPVGSHVRAGQVLARFSSAELNTLQTTFAETIRYAGRMRAASVTGEEKLLQGRLNLQWRGMSKAEVERLEQTRVPIKEIDVVSPVSGILTEVNIVPGRIVNAGTRGDLFSASGARIFRIAEDDALLIEAQLPAEIAAGLEVEDRMLVSLAGLESTREAIAVISNISPLVPAASRMRTVRLIPSDRLMARLVVGQRLLLRLPDKQENRHTDHGEEIHDAHQPSGDAEAVPMPEQIEQTPAAGSSFGEGAGHE